jgi:hypothetical protein
MATIDFQVRANRAALPGDTLRGIEPWSATNA